MKWCIENKEWTIAELDIAHLRFLERRVFMNDNEGASIRSGAERIVDETSAQHLISRKKLGHLPHVVALRPIHAPTANMKSGCICKDRRLHREFGSISKRRNLLDVLIVFFGKAFLGLGGAVMVHHAFEIAGGNRAKPNRSEIAKQCHRYSWLLPVRMREHNSSLLCFRIENGTQNGIKFRIN